MTRAQIILASFSILSLLFANLYFFRGQVKAWWKERPAKRAARLKAEQDRLAEVARVRDELAEKYLPPTAAPPRQQG